MIGRGLNKYSEQELVDCVTTSSGCNGGTTYLVYDWLANNKFCTLKSYPYLGKNGSCKASTCDHVGTPDKGHGLVTNGEKGLLSKIYEGPLTVSVDASTWKNYKGGIMSSGCGMTTNHAVVVVGFKDAGAGSYWTIRNSWSTSWGEQGYIRLKYGSNMCNIGVRPSYPVFK
jgi:C1A family cysteine protease